MESWFDEVISASYMEGDCFCMSFICYNLFPNIFAQVLNFWFECEVFTNFIFNMSKPVLSLEISIKIYIVITVLKKICIKTE